ncbi:MAG: TIGR04190 family B12-binding domain/radical SAM domain protein [Coriobacteriia bacterium]|nr:TIGR04190 family B12-binding domain/radical SAM domain protein [Coriobacteriia bacterium]
MTHRKVSTTQNDLIILHAPSVYDFRKRPSFFGPVADLVPATPIFDIYPLGFASIGEYLERHGFYVRIINVANLMLRSANFNVERLIAGLHPKSFGIDLHWMPHCQGAIELARICKKYHPDIPVIFGGHSSSVFHEELLSNYPEIDFVLRGDSTEEPFRQLLTAITTPHTGPGYAAPTDLRAVGNLSWRDATGAVIANDITYSPADFNAPSLDFSYNMKAVIRYRDMLGASPFEQFIHEPASAGLVCRGCTHNCATCGGSAAAYRKYYGRNKVAFRDPELVARDVAHSSKFIPGLIFILNDPLQAGPAYFEELIRQLGAAELNKPVAFEFFAPPTPDQLALMAEQLSDWSIEVSAESHDDEIRRNFGKGQYTTAQLEDNIKLALELGVNRYDVYFMTGIPGQDAASVRASAQYLRRLYELNDNDKRIFPFISPMAPFLDVGSRVFDDPEAFGYRLKAHTVEEHRQLLLEPSWKHIMNYESRLLPTDEFADLVYEAAHITNDIKEEVGVTSPEAARSVRQRLIDSQATMHKIDRLRTLPAAAYQQGLAEMEQEILDGSQPILFESIEEGWVSRPTFANFAACFKLWLVENLLLTLTLGRHHATSDLPRSGS